MRGEGRTPLPIVPPPLPEERLSSWLERVADVYLVSLDELQAHVGWARPALELEREPALSDVECIAAATSSSVERLFAMTFHDLPSRYRNLLRWKAGEICPAYSQGMQRPPRLKAWSFAFSFWCERHRQPLFSRDTCGVSALGDYWAARRGGAILNRWGMGKGADRVPVETALSLLHADPQSVACGSVGIGQIVVAATARALPPIETLPTPCADNCGAGIRGRSPDL